MTACVELETSALKPPAPIEDDFMLTDENIQESLCVVLENLLSVNSLRGHALECEEKQSTTDNNNDDNNNNNNNNNKEPTSPAAILEAMDDHLTIPVSYLMELTPIRAILPWGCDIKIASEFIAAAARMSQAIVVHATPKELRVGPFPQASPRSRCTLLIQGVDNSITVRDLQQEIQRCSIFHFRRVTADTINVTFEDARSAKRAFVALQGKSLCGCASVQVKMRVECDKQSSLSLSAASSGSIQQQQQQRHSWPNTKTMSNTGVIKNNSMHSNNNSTIGTPLTISSETSGTPLSGDRSTFSRPALNKVSRGSGTYQHLFSQQYGGNVGVGRVGGLGVRGRGKLSTERRSYPISKNMGGQMTQDMCAYALQGYMMNAAAAAAVAASSSSSSSCNNNNNNNNINYYRRPWDRLDSTPSTYNSSTFGCDNSTYGTHPTTMNNSSSYNNNNNNNNYNKSAGVSSLNPPFPVGDDGDCEVLAGSLLYDMNSDARLYNYPISSTSTNSSPGAHSNSNPTISLSNLPVGGLLPPPLPIAIEAAPLQQQEIQQEQYQYHQQHQLYQEPHQMLMMNNNNNNNTNSPASSSLKDNSKVGVSPMRRLQRDPYKGGVFVTSPALPPLPCNSNISNIKIPSAITTGEEICLHISRGITSSSSVVLNTTQGNGGVEDEIMTSASTINGNSSHSISDGDNNNNNSRAQQLNNQIMIKTTNTGMSYADVIRAASSNEMQRESESYESSTSTHNSNNNNNNNNNNNAGNTNNDAEDIKTDTTTVNSPLKEVK